MAVGGVGVAGVPEGFDEGGEGGMGTALEVEHASPPAENHLTLGGCGRRLKLMRL